MSDPKTTQNHDSGADHAPATAQRMSELLPLVAQKLRGLGIHTVYAPYYRKSISVVLIGEREPSLSEAVEIVATMTTAIGRALQSILQRRYPEAMTDAASGHFEWDLAADTLQHEHVMTHKGI
ncbi:MAG: hypothetical protein JSR66_32780 [Proteobacteria bacterium]|nr:hypothetical protein [Pseudomonadota bacterium]